MFGGGEAAAPAPVPMEPVAPGGSGAGSGAASGDRRLDEPTLSDGLISGLLAKADDPLTVGGQLSLRLQYTWADEHARNENVLSSPSLLHLFLDARPNEHVRAYASGRLTYDFTLQDGRDAQGMPGEALGTLLDQLWLKADIGEVVYLTVGRQPIRWGSGRFWNPTDFLNQQRRDPLAILDERVGPTLLKLHFPVESLGWNFYAVANLDGASSPEELGGALRGEFLFGPVELAATAAYRKDQPVRLGLDASAGVWLLDLRLEAAVVYDDHTPYWKGDFVWDPPALPYALSRDDRWIPQVTAGAELSFKYSDEDSLILGVEYFFNDAGYPDEGLYDWLLLQAFEGEGGFTPFYLGRHYLAGYAVLMGPGSWNDTTVLLSGIGNLNDLTGILRLDWQVRVLTYLDVAVFGAVRLGGDGEFHYGTEYKMEDPPNPLVPEPLRYGFSIGAPRLEVGVWLTLAL
ncbi:MAG TPA: hypothetical protein PK668_26990 [Myxococcota bacterium]|nr:hypothetical protein [Myxococcota bacterium]HRY97175.1 hypothetical protein [Myxococcota bacterium]HSA21135.1 hypothetical protein [Myxococcota bacterium]